MRDRVSPAKSPAKEMFMPALIVLIITPTKRVDNGMANGDVVERFGQTL